MLRKTIEAVIAKKIKGWTDSITDEAVREIVKSNIVISGGAIVSLMQNEEPNDFDVYLKTKDACLAVAKYYANVFNEQHGIIKNKIDMYTRAVVIDGDSLDRTEDIIYVRDTVLAGVLGKDKFPVEAGYTGMSRMVSNTPPGRIKMYIQSDGVAGDPDTAKPAPVSLPNPVSLLDDADGVPAETLETGKPPYSPVFISTNAITLSDKIQIIVRYYGTAEELHENFDYVHTRGYYESWTGNVTIPESVYESVMNKTLIYSGSKYPICSVMRMRKFIQRGWTINAGQVLKMAFQISELDLTDIDVLEEQLVGVDSLYFANLINQLRRQKEKDPTWDISQSYVVSVINKIF